jgi:hypothetical protein
LPNQQKGVRFDFAIVFAIAVLFNAYQCAFGLLNGLQSNQAHNFVPSVLPKLLRNTASQKREPKFFLVRKRVNKAMSGPTLRLNAKKAAPPSHAGGAFPNAELLVYVFLGLH